MFSHMAVYELMNSQSYSRDADFVRFCKRIFELVDSIFR